MKQTAGVFPFWEKVAKMCTRTDCEIFQNRGGIWNRGDMHHWL